MSQFDVSEEQIHVLRTEDAEYLSAQPIAVYGDKTFPMGQVLLPIYVTDDHIVIGTAVHIVGGQLSDLLFGYEQFIMLAEAGYFGSVTGEEAKRLVAYLRLNKSTGQ
jgi:hypothetical protein